MFVGAFVALLGLTLPDGRSYRVIASDGIGQYIKLRVASLAAEAIAEKGSFSMSIGSGTTVTPLAELAPPTSLPGFDRPPPGILGHSLVDWAKVHIFFGNDRTEGESAGKCFNSAATFIAACGIPEENVHRVPLGEAAESADAYDKMLRDMPAEVLGRCERTGAWPSIEQISC